MYLLLLSYFVFYFLNIVFEFIVFKSVIKFCCTGALEVTQFGDQVRMRLILQLIYETPRVLLKVT